MDSITIMSVIDIDTARKIAAKDGLAVSTSKDFDEANQVAYYVAINSWLLIVRDYSGYAHVYLGDAIISRGLLPVIKDCQADADLVVHNRLSDLSTLGMSLYEDIKAYTSRQANRLQDGMSIGTDPVATLLFILRYLKRFSPLKNDIIQAESLRDFVQTENRTKMLQRRESSRYVLDLVRDEVHRLYPWDRIVADIKARCASDLRFSSGAGFDSKANLGSKLSVIAKHPEGIFYFPTPFGARMLDIPRDRDADEQRIVRVQAVPKSYKAARIIAMEDTYRLAQAKDIEYIFRKYDRQFHDIDLEDQTINQELARKGSEDGLLATLDASHASDLISKTLFREIFPQNYVELVEPLLGTHCLVDGKLRPMQMLSTSGHALTFRHETIVYKCIPLAADRLYSILAGIDDSDPLLCKPFAWAYGDDAIVPTRSAELCIEFYEALGLKINRDKSFYADDGIYRYRESCGEEYRNGDRMTTVYFPRFPVVGVWKKGTLSLSSPTYHDEYRGKLDNSLTMLIDLQKKVFPFSRSASTFLFNVVKKAFPKMTTSLAGTTCTDLWGYQDTGIARGIRAYEIVEDESPYRSVRMASRRFRKLSTPPLSTVALETLSRAATRDSMHYCPTVVYNLDPKSITDEKVRIFDMYRYQKFLKDGPTYADPLMELLKVSEPPMTIAMMYGKKSLATKLI
jgi:hypothetical protein